MYNNNIIMESYGALFKLMGENMKIQIYDKPGCPKCRLTENALSKNGIKFTKTTLLVAGDKDNEELTRQKISQFKGMGYRSFPIVFIEDNDGKVIDSWCDFRTDKIKELVE
mgnify:CR=1 FL=1